MFVIRDHEHVKAPVERCFLLATHLGLVADVLEMETQPAAGCRTEGLAQGNDLIRWQGHKFGLPQIHVSRITAYDCPRFFQDTMEQGRFRSFQHEHRFDQVGEHTLMVDRISFSMPMGYAGRLVGRHIVLPHVVGLLRRRLAMLKRIAESDQWRRYLPDSIEQPVQSLQDLEHGLHPEIGRAS